jgi:RNA polymerase sigma-70 factor, ECF subfamily
MEMMAEGDKFNQVTRSIAGWLRAGFQKGRGEVVDLKPANGYALRDSKSNSQNLYNKSMDQSSPHEVTQLLQDWRNGNEAALEKLMPLVYDELRKLANHYLRGERKDHTLQGTALVHEAYMKMVGYTDLAWQSRAHFYGVAARLMRQILIDHARKHRSDKRGAGKQNIPLEEAAVFSIERADNLVALDDALVHLMAVDPLKSRFVELRYFGGLTIEEIAEVESVSISTVKRHMRMAEAWLHRELNRN